MTNNAFLPPDSPEIHEALTERWAEFLPHGKGLKPPMADERWSEDEPPIRLTPLCIAEGLPGERPQWIVACANGCKPEVFTPEEWMRLKVCS